MLSGHRSIPPGHSTQPKSELMVTALTVFWLQQFQKHTAAAFGFDDISSLQSVVETDARLVSVQRSDRNDASHDESLVQRGDIGRLVVAAGQLPSCAQLCTMQRSPL